MFLDQDFLSDLARANGLEVEPDQFNAWHARLVYEFDSHVRENQRFPLQTELTQSHWQRLFEQAGLIGSAADQAGRLAEARHRQRALWTYTYSWIRETLDVLKRAGYGMSVVSNEEGLLNQELSDLDLLDYFDLTLDAAGGISKPLPGIYEAALKKLGLRSEECLFVGNVFHIDIWGANRVGMPGLHLDPLGLCAEWLGARIGDLRQLPAWLEAYSRAPEDFDTLSLRDFVLLAETGSEPR